jgi:excisionase family DNA binding protein
MTEMAGQSFSPPHVPEGWSVITRQTQRTRPMGAYTSRSSRHDGNRLPLGDDPKANTASRTGIQAGGGASSQSSHAIEPITMRVPDACRYIGISRSTLYLLIADGEIEIIKLGCSTLVLTESLKALIGRRRGLAESHSALIGN